jgi:hypothetical protein
MGYFTYLNEKPPDMLIPPTPPRENMRSMPGDAIPFRGLENPLPPLLPCPFGLNISQNLSDSSAPAVNICVPSGDFAICNTLAV